MNRIELYGIHELLSQLFMHEKKKNDEDVTNRNSKKVTKSDKIKFYLHFVTICNKSRNRDLANSLEFTAIKQLSALLKGIKSHKCQSKLCNIILLSMITKVQKKRENIVCIFDGSPKIMKKNREGKHKCKKGNMQM